MIPSFKFRALLLRSWDCFRAKYAFQCAAVDTSASVHCTAVVVQGHLVLRCTSLTTGRISSAVLMWPYDPIIALTLAVEDDYVVLCTKGAVYILPIAAHLELGRLEASQTIKNSIFTTSWSEERYHRGCTYRDVALSESGLRAICNLPLGFQTTACFCISRNRVNSSKVAVLVGSADGKLCVLGLDSSNTEDPQIIPIARQPITKIQCATINNVPHVFVETKEFDYVGDISAWLLPGLNQV